MIVLVTVLAWLADLQAAGVARKEMCSVNFDVYYPDRETLWKSDVPSGGLAGLARSNPEPAGAIAVEQTGERREFILLNRVWFPQQSSSK